MRITACALVISIMILLYMILFYMLQSIHERNIMQITPSDPGYSGGNKATQVQPAYFYTGFPEATLNIIVTPSVKPQQLSTHSPL